MTFTTRLTAAVLCGVVVAASVPATASAHAPRAELLDVVPVSTMDTGQLVACPGDRDLDASHVIDAFRKPTTASALIALRRNGNRTPRQAAWLHGTTGYRSAVADGNDRAAALLFASAGYLGPGPGHHPYVDARPP